MYRSRTMSITPKYVVGRTITAVRPLSRDIIRRYRWNPRTTAMEIVLDDGTRLVPSTDPDHNDVGVIFGITPTGEKFTLLPKK